MTNILLLAIVLAALAGGCTTAEEVAPTPSLDVSLRGLPVLGSGGEYYQLWATFYSFAGGGATEQLYHDEGYVSLGRFTVGEDGRPTGGARFTLPPGADPQLLDDIIVTVQGAPDRGSGARTEEPGPVVLGGKLFGDRRKGIAELTTGYMDAFGTDFARVSGNYSLLAPTSDPSDSNAGIWFVEQPAAPVAGLHELPRLPDKWTYEGWVVRPDPSGGAAAFSTGRFLSADSADLDGPGAGCGPGSGLQFPGQDFITGPLIRPALEGGGFWFMVTIEPRPDFSPEPFGLRVLSTEFQTVPVTPQRTRPFQNVSAAHMPQGRVTLHR